MAWSAVMVGKNQMPSRQKIFLGAINIDGDVDGPARANASSADLHAPSLLLKQSSRDAFGTHLYFCSNRTSHLGSKNIVCLENLAIKIS
jgi:hypothetical protein